MKSPLITPALFSHRPPPNREKREQAITPQPGSPLPVGGRGWERGQG
jgi:hypothetical protein